MTVQRERLVFFGLFRGKPVPLPPGSEESLGPKDGFSLIVLSPDKVERDRTDFVLGVGDFGQGLNMTRKEVLKKEEINAAGIRSRRTLLGSQKIFSWRPD